MSRAVAATSEVAVGAPNHELTLVTAHFAQAFLRWLDASPEGGLTFPRLRVLETLHCQGPAKMKDLADEIGLSARNLTALADGLETEGLIRRVAHPTDRRATLLQLTPAGQDEADRSLAPRLTEIGLLFDELTPTARAALHRALSSMTETMRAKRVGCPNA